MELAVSLGIFLMVSTVVTLAVARSLGVGTEAKLTRTSASAADDLLSTMAGYPYDDLVNGTFTVPEPCLGVGAGSGIGGKSCVKASGTDLQVSYYYQNYDQATGAGSCPDLATNPNATGPLNGLEMSTDSKSVGLCAIVKEPDGTVPNYATMTSRIINAPSADYSPGKSVIRVFVSGDPALPSYPTGLVLVSDKNPTRLVSGPTTLTEGMAVFTLNPATQCTELDPCAVALAPSQTPATVQGTGLYGSAARPDAGIVGRAGTPVDVSVSIQARASIIVKPTAAGSAPTQIDTVCISAWHTDPTHSMFECNTAGVSDILFDQEHVTQSGLDVTYPLPAGALFTASVDPTSGVCPTQNRAALDDGTWTEGPVCSSWTWGNAPNVNTVLEGVAAGAAIPTLDMPWPGNTPAAGLTPAASAWNQARVLPGCAADSSCSPVLDAPEDYACPQEACLSVGGA